MKLRKLISRKPWHQLVIEEGTEAQFMACFKRLRFTFCALCKAPILLRYGGEAKRSCRNGHACRARVAERRASEPKNVWYQR